MNEEQLQRQDLVDNTIFQMLCDLHPHDGGEVGGWDIELIGGLRDLVQQWFVDKGICTEEEFYPSISDENLLQ